jgi:hypothetical protein
MFAGEPSCKHSLLLARALSLGSGSHEDLVMGGAPTPASWTSGDPA